MHTEKLAASGAITKSLLICSAIEAELDRLQPVCDTLGADRLVCGIGNIEAAISLTRCLAEQSYNEVVFAGSCGVYGDFSGAYSSVFSSEFVQQDLGMLLGRSYSPGARRIVHKPGPFGQMLQKGRRAGVTNCPGSVTLDLTSADTSGLSFENLECYGLARAAELAGVRFCAVFAVTNAVGPAGSDQWRANFRAFSDLLQEEIDLALRRPKAG